MTRFFYIFLFLIFGLCSCHKKTESSIKIAPEFKSDYRLTDSIEFEDIRNVAYGYKFSRPITFTEQIDRVGQVDSIVFISENEDARLIYFVEGTVSNQDTLKNYLYQYFHKLEVGKQSKEPNCRILKSQMNYSNKFSNYRGNFIAIGEKNNEQFVWKTELSEVPISGDLTYKTMLFVYPKIKNQYYEPVGIELSKRFGDMFR